MTKEQIDSLYHKLKSKNLLLNKCPRANFFEAIADQARRDLSINETAENILKTLLSHLVQNVVFENDAPEESSGGQTKEEKLKKTDDIINETGNFFKTRIRIVTEEDDVLYPKQEVNAPSSSSADQNGPIILGRITCVKVKKKQYFNTAKYEDNYIDFPKKTEEDRGKKDDILMRFSVKAAKWVSTLVIFGAVLLGALVTKSTLFVLANAYTQDYSDSRCPYVKEGQVQQYYYPRYMVMLILMSCLCFPEVLVFFYSLWKLLKSTKKKDTTSPTNKLDWRKLVLATVPDIFHAIGLTFLVLKVIPNIDATLACLLFPLVHVLFDDAFKDGQLNDYVNRLLELIGPAAEKIPKGSSDNIKGTSCETPYGGRIQFELPWGKYFNIHLKDNSKIRHRKRWSQCMYMHYILKYLQREENFDLENTYLLALDGDVDFQPTSLTTLLDLMKRDKNLGAACGRIHPIGSGPVVWFQKFEYAVGHWLQKTTEDVLGCVLCSPGCFSLFRGSALIEPNVAGNYSNIASSPQQKIQWDQGEDRWLCTLLLKAGKKIEYCAVSDSYTFAPEEFKEFYNQRRRWGPSTLANVFDILLDAKLAIRENECINHGYIAYQIGLMAASLLGPATVVLIIQGAFQYVFGMSPIGGLMAALIPVIFFVIICYTTNLNFQIIVAQILSLIYALVMMAVLVGVIGQMVDNILNPTSLFMLVMIGMFGITGILHPSEILCLLHGVLYYICVPSAFIFLVIYSYCNMHDVTWGTREEKSPDENKQKAPSKDGGDIEMQNRFNGSYSCGWLNSCKCAMCLSPYKTVLTEEPRYEKNMKQNETRGTQTENQTSSDESSNEKTACRKQSKKWWNLEDHALFKNMEVL
ncbi:chitin synthase chs-2-like [Styela clava]